MRAGFPHSEIFGSKLACQLPEAYRRLQRPSSPVVAKASTTCTYSLDPITVSTASLEHGAPPQASLCAWWDHGRLSRHPNTSNAISYPDESGRLRQPDSPCFFQIFKEQPKKSKMHWEERSLHIALCGKLVEPTGIEPVTSCLQSRRSPS